VLWPASLGLSFRILPAFHVLVIGHAIYPVQAFLNCTHANIFIAFPALSLLKHLIPHSVCAALAEKARARSQEQHNHSATHFRPFLLRANSYLCYPVKYQAIFYVKRNKYTVQPCTRFRTEFSDLARSAALKISICIKRVQQTGHEGGRLPSENPTILKHERFKKIRVNDPRVRSLLGNPIHKKFLRSPRQGRRPEIFRQRGRKVIEMEGDNDLRLDS